MRNSLAIGTAAASKAAAIAIASNSTSCDGNTCSGIRQPNARTLTTATRHQPTASPSGTASKAVSSASAMVLASSTADNRGSVIPMAHSGASCGRRAFASVKRLVSSAIAATPRVKALSAAVTAKVLSKIRFDSAFTSD